MLMLPVPSPTNTRHLNPTEIHIEPLVVISLQAPLIADGELSLMEKSFLFGRAWGEYIPQAVVLA